ncbi:hypothetical protein SSX86_006835 [Deinandra increscens subsp. villosa]|uniref:PHD finger protein n=1 Tax=Deinandra increscens subsp. villosa TaxID=3103831 RepID=A0AAP0DJQ0_9ASTR
MSIAKSDSGRKDFYLVGTSIKSPSWLRGLLEPSSGKAHNCECESRVRTVGHSAVPSSTFICPKRIFKFNYPLKGFPPVSPLNFINEREPHQFWSPIDSMMDEIHETETDMDMDAVEVRSGSAGEKRALEEGDVTDLVRKKARVGGEVRLGGCLKEVAEMVLVLATMGKMRGGRRPTAVEVKLMAEARGKLAEVCGEFAPKAVFPTDAFGTVIEDLGLNRLRETKLGILPQRMSIAQKLQLTKQKMEKSEVFPLHSATYVPKVSGPHETPHTVQTVASGKADHTPISSRSFQNNSFVVHASQPSNSRTLPYQLPTSEVRPVGSNVLISSNLGRGSTVSPIEQAGRQHIRSDGRLNANSVGDHKASHTPTWSIQSQSASSNKAGLNNGSSHLTNINHHMQHHMNFAQPPAANTHNEIAKIVQKVLQPHTPDRQTWNPPSRDYMNKALTCLTCKSMINEVDTVLVCDACERGYHLRCLQCNPKSIFGDDCREWHCAKCLAISNGKPLPLKYGRVMRNVNTPKKSASPTGSQPSLEKKVQSSDENFNQRLMSANGDSVSQTSTDMQVSGTHECGPEKLSSEKCQSNLQALGNREDADACSKPLTQNGIKLESNPKGESGENEGVVERGNIVKTSENGITDRENAEAVERGNIVKTSESCTTVRENEGPLPSIMHDVEWVGGVTNEINGKMYYGSCCISGTTYKLQDYALFSSTGINLMPNKLQGMWEDNMTNKKWVTVTRCFFPDDLPEGVGRPCAPESNEVYESNHETTLAAGLIHGPCKVLPPRKFSEERDTQTHSQAKTSDKPEQFYLCKWFYDEKKRLFRDVSC